MADRLPAACAALFASLSLQFPADAAACSGLFCDQTKISTAPADGATIPANAPGVLAQTGWFADLLALELDGGDAGTPRTTLELAAPGNFHDQALLKLDEPLVVGRTYRLKASNRCSVTNDGGIGSYEKTWSFTAGPASALPTTIGSAQVSYLVGKLGGRYGLSVDGTPAPSYDSAPVAVAQIAIQPSAELAPYLPLIRFSTYVDGVLWGESHFGHGIASYEAFPEQVTFRDFTRVFATCTREAQSAACESSGVAKGVHEVELRAHVAGAATDPAPLRFPITLSCAGDGGGPDGQAPDASGSGGAPDAGAPDARGAGGIGGSARSPTPQASGADDDGGCSVAPAPAASGAGARSLALFLGCVATMRGVRRRGRQWTMNWRGA